MTGLLILINRALYGALGLIALAAGAASLSTWLDSDPELTARPLPSFTLEPVTEHAEIRFPDHNIFDPSGLPWRGAVASAAKTGRGASQPKGIVRLPGLDGVLTDTGFVRPGQMLPGGRLKAVVPGGYVVAGPNGDVTTPLDPDRQARIKTVLAPPPQKPTPSGAVK